MKILNFGSLNLDYVYSVDHFLRPGETMHSLNRSVFSGGKGLNQSIALSRAGALVYHAGAVGADDYGQLLDELENNKVNVDFIKKIDNISTGHAIIMVEKNGQNAIMLYGGANQAITTEQIDCVFESFSKKDVIVLQNEINYLDKIIEKASEKGMTIVLNPSPMSESLKEMPLELVDIMLLNEVEAKDLCSDIDGGDLVESVKEKFKGKKIVLTLGKEGAYYIEGDVEYFQPSYAVETIDTTAAGDTFTGYFLATFLMEKDIKKSLEIAAKAAAISVTRKGAASSIPYLDEVINSQIK